jgi:hypothetical protein
LPAPVPLCLHLAFVFQDSPGTVHCSQVGPSLHWFREEAPNVGDDTGFLKSCNPMDWNVAHLTICLAKNLHILRGDKNGSHHICLGWNLQDGPNF